ncbi:MAG: glycosyltransferase family 2 protein [Faecousia sp.]
MATISVLMGIYNCASTLEEAVACICTQSYEDWELIMCDDGSSDNTLEVANQLAVQDDRIKVISNDHNMGLAATLNRCLIVANGEYVARMDGDDVCPYNRFQSELTFLQRHSEYVLVSGWMECFDAQGTYGTIRYCETPQYKDFVCGSQFCHAGSMMRRDVLQELGGYSSAPHTERVEDYDLWVRLYAAGYKGYNLQQVVYSMRDDRNAYHRRKFKYRINESRVSYRVYKDCHLPLSKLRYPILPICKGLLPPWLYARFHRKRVNV